VFFDRERGEQKATFERSCKKKEFLLFSLLRSPSQPVYLYKRKPLSFATALHLAAQLIALTTYIESVSLKERRKKKEERPGLLKISNRNGVASG
jgi:hypothetical protein